MSPAEKSPSPGERPVRRVRCERCFDVLASCHPWDRVTCSCGELTVTGAPWEPSVSWRSSPGGGWSEVDDAAGEADDQGMSDDTADDADAVETGDRPGRRTRLGYVG